jgi:hypothetical protein
MSSVDTPKTNPTEADSMAQKDVESLVHMCLLLHTKNCAHVIHTQILGSLLDTICLYLLHFNMIILKYFRLH